MCNALSFLSRQMTWLWIFCELQGTPNIFLLRTSSFKPSLNLGCSPSSSVVCSSFNPIKSDQSCSSKPSPKQLPVSQDLKMSLEQEFGFWQGAKGLLTICCCSQFNCGTPKFITANFCILSSLVTWNMGIFFSNMGFFFSPIIRIFS